MEVGHSEHGHKGSFFIEDAGILVAEMVYSFAGPGKLVIDHTNVAEQFRHQGLGNNLVDAIVSYSRDKGLRIVPVCPFARSVFESTSGYDDVLE